MLVSHTACLGAGVIGASWTALFLAAGKSVAVYDPQADAEARVRNHVARSWPALEALGLTERGTPDAMTFHTSAAAAVEGAQFVQENAPERLGVKHATYAEIEPALSPSALVASSTSGLKLSDLTAGWRDASRFVIGHPFNPPHLIPLVEVMGGPATASGVVDAARAFYEGVGKTTIEIKREKSGLVANRLQAAIWREAIALALEGVASVEDIDKAVSAGPGLRWAAMGPTMLFHLGAGPRGLAGFVEHFEGTFNGWWDELGDVRLDSAVAQTLSAGVADAANGADVAALAEQRDAMIVAMLNAKRAAETKTG